MSTSPPPAKGTFCNITPGGLSPNRDESSWTVTAVDGSLHLAWAGPETASILRHDAPTGKWQTLHQRSARKGSKTGKGTPSIPVVELRTLHAPHDPALYVKLTTGREMETLRCRLHEATCEPLPKHFADFAEAFLPGTRSVGTSWEVVLDASELRIRSRRKGSRWKKVALPDLPASSSPDRALVFGDQVVLTVNDSILGLSVFVRPGKASAKTAWTPCLSRGGQRFTPNAEVLAAVPWNDALYLACGRSGPTAAGKSAVGFELLRIYSDASWDLLVGSPRVSAQGFKVPLTGLGPGTNLFEPSRFCFLTASGNQLLMGTFDDLAGFRIWRSDSGEDWAAGDAELVGIDRVSGATPVPLKNGIALLLELDGPIHGPTFALWLGA